MTLKEKFFRGVCNSLQPRTFKGLKTPVLIGLITNWQLESVALKTKVTVKYQLFWNCILWKSSCFEKVAVPKK